MQQRIECIWCLEPGGTRYRVEATFQGATVATTVEAASVTDQRQRQAVEQLLADKLAAQLDLPYGIGPLK